MVKVNNAIYLWEDDLVNIDINKLERIGKIEFSYNSGRKRLDLKDVNFSSNVCSKGDEIYKYDDTRIVVVSEKTKSIFRKNDQ